MSVETSNRVWKQSGKGGTPLLLLLAMADWSDDWGYCHPSIEQMAGSIDRNPENARVTDDMATRSSVQAEEGGCAFLIAIKVAEGEAAEFLLYPGE